MRFIADDGKIFDTAEECKEYEEKSNNPDKEIAKLWNNYIETYDCEGHEIKSKYNWENYKDYLNNIEDTLESTYFIRICCTSEEWEKIRKYLRTKYNICYLPYKPGLLRLSNTFDGWVNFTEEYENFKTTWAPMGIQIIASN